MVHATDLNVYDDGLSCLEPQVWLVAGSVLQSGAAVISRNPRFIYIFRLCRDHEYASFISGAMIEYIHNPHNRNWYDVDEPRRNRYP